jgi:hypothetical protein
MADTDWFLGIRIIRDRQIKKLWLCRDSYVDKLSIKFNLQEVRMPRTQAVTLKPHERTSTKAEIFAYQQRIGSINFAAVTTSPNIAKACPILRQFLRNPS